MVNTKNKVVRFRYLPKFFCKINKEIKIFNKMKIVMPCRRGYAMEYLDCYKRLMQKPNSVFPGGDGIAKLFYAYACAKLFLRSDNQFVRKQMLKNCLYVFGAKTIVKKQGKAKLLDMKFYTHRQVAFKYLGSEILDGANFELRGQELCKRNSASYITYYNDDVSVKYYVARNMPAQCYEVTGTANTFSYIVGDDKMKFDLTHTADTFYASCKGQATAMFVNGRANFGSSLAEKCEELRIYAELQGNAKIFIIKGKTKSEVVRMVSQVKHSGCNVDYLFDSKERKIAREIEETYAMAERSKYVSGEDLRDKYVATNKIIPTLYLPTLVYNMQRVQDFFDVVDRAWLFERIACVGRNLNLVFLYSSQNDEIREIINAFVDKSEMKSLINAGVFVFFVDRIKESNPVVNFLNLMAEVRKNPNKARKHKDIDVTSHIGNNFPITHSFFVRNTHSRTRSAKVDVHIDLGTPSVIWKDGAILHAVGLKNYSKPYNYKIPTGGVVDIKNQLIATSFAITLDVKLAPHEEKVFKIVKNDGVPSRAEKKQAFIGSIEDLKIVSSDLRLTKLFASEIIDKQTDTKKLDMIKRAVSNYDKELFFVLLRNHRIDSDLWTFLIEKVIGIKLVKGKIQLMPCVQITGDFELRFSYKGSPYKFMVKQSNSGFIINYLEKEFKNFAQLDVDVI